MLFSKILHSKKDELLSGLMLFPNYRERIEKKPSHTILGQFIFF